MTSAQWPVASGGVAEYRDGRIADCGMEKKARRHEGEEGIARCARNDNSMSDVGCNGVLDGQCDERCFAALSMTAKGAQHDGEGRSA